MMTFRLFEKGSLSIPSATAWYLSDLGEARGKQDPWPYVNFVLYTFKTAYREFEERVGQIKAPRGEKSDLVLRAVERARGPFRVSDIQRECPGVSVDLIRHVLKDLRGQGKTRCLGRGQSAQWERTR